MLARSWTHTALLSSFCIDIALNFADYHENFRVDYTYNFNMHRFNVLDHFLLSDILFKESVDSVSTVHNIDNISDHEQVILQLCLNVH